MVSREDMIQAEGARAICESIRHDFEQHPNREITNEFVVEMCRLLAKGLCERYGI